jgi:hypothetical protein
MQMANVNGRLSLSLYDGQGGGGTFLTHVTVPDTGTFANAITALGALKTLYLTVGGAGIKQAEFSIIDKSLASSPADSNRIGSGAVFDFSAGSPVTTYGELIPQFLPALVASDGSIDITATVQAAFVTSLTGAVMGGTYTNAAYASLIAGLDAFPTNRKRKRRVRP